MISQAIPASSSAPKATIAALAMPLRPSSSAAPLLTVTVGVVCVSCCAGGIGVKGLDCARAAAGATSVRAMSNVARRASMSSAYVGQEALEHEPVAWSEGLPVVVVVHEGVVAPRELAQPHRPLTNLGVGVVPAPPARAPVEPHEGEVRGPRRRRQGPARVVGQHARDVVLAQQRVHLVDEPAGLAELEGVSV